MTREKGFTLIELISIILLLCILAVTAVAKWPKGFDQDAARMEMTMAIRHDPAIYRSRFGLGNQHHEQCLFGA